MKKCSVSLGVCRLSPGRLIVLTPVLLLMFAFTSPAQTPCSAANTFIYGYNFANDHLLRFSAANPGTPLLDVPITGLNANESLEGIDFRPANGQLYAIASNQLTERLVTVHPLT